MTPAAQTANKQKDREAAAAARRTRGPLAFVRTVTTPRSSVSMRQPRRGSTAMTAPICSVSQSLRDVCLSPSGDMSPSGNKSISPSGGFCISPFLSALLSFQVVQVYLSAQVKERFFLLRGSYCC
ncbi:unnamed protein product, partial [Ectocarpus sp. 13 AM-2016]